MQPNRRNKIQLESPMDASRSPTNNSVRASTLDSGRGSMVDSSRPTTLDASPTNGASSSLSRDTPLDSSDPNDDNAQERPVRIEPTGVMGHKCYEQAFVSHIDHPSAFFIQLAHSQKQYVELHRQINEAYSKTPMNNPLWKQGAYCIAKYTDNEFYRGRIVEVPQVNETADLYDVVFVDFGNWSKVALADIHRILPEYAKLPAQAIPCSLNRTLPIKDHSYDPDAIKLFGELALEKFVDATFYLKSNRDFWPLHFVDIKISATGENIRDRLKKFIRDVSNDQIYVEFSQSMKRVDYIIYSIPYEDDDE